MPSIIDPLTLKQKIKFFRSYNAFVKYFPERSVDLELDKLKTSELVTEYLQPLTNWSGKVLNHHDPSHMGVAEPLGTKRTHYRFHKDGWERSAPVICTCWRVPSQYQGLPQGKMLVALLREARPFLQNFTTTCYEINDHENSQNEFYLELGASAEGHSSLYVPYGAFLAGDIDAVKKRNKDYFGWYNKKKDIWGVMKEIDTTKCFFENMLAWEGK